MKTYSIKVITNKKTTKEFTVEMDDHENFMQWLEVFSIFEKDKTITYKEKDSERKGTLII
jgi:hypothetical protein|tara:strand:- start:128 stop:307 length:180 start_codon:yes stop_codon:yes gene_type:complete